MALKLKGSTSGFVGLDAPAVAGNNTLILPENSGSAFQLFGNDITAGVTTFTQVTVSRNGDLTVPGTISIGGTLTYEDVTSVDSVGIVTARGLSIFGNTSGLNVTGVATFTGNVSLGDDDNLYLGASNDLRIYHNAGGASHINNTGLLVADGTTGVRLEYNNATRVDCTSTGVSLVGDVDVADKIIHTGDTNTAIRFPAADTFTVETTGIERARITGTGLGINTDFTGSQTWRSGPRIEVFGGSGNYTGELHLGANRGDGTQSVGSINFFENTQDANHKHIALIEADKTGVTSNKRGGDLVFYTKANNVAAPIERLRINSTGQLVMTNTITTEFIDLTSTNNSTRAVIAASGKDSSGNAVTLKMGGFGDTQRGEIFTLTNHDLGFATNNAATQFKCKTGGNFEIVDGDLVVASGHGIDFSATGNASGMSNELLDDYEEGSWTPAYGSSSVTSSTYTNTAGYYTLIGNTVFYTGRIQMSDSVVNGNPITMGGFPFSAASAVGKQGGFDITFIDNWYSGSSTTNAQVTFLNSGGTAYGYFYDGDGNTIAANATYDSARRTLHFKGHYFI